MGEKIDDVLNGPQMEPENGNRPKKTNGDGIDPSDRGSSGLKRPPRGLSVGPILVSVGILIVTLVLWCAKFEFLEMRDLLGYIALVGAFAIIVGIAYWSVCTYITLRRRESLALWSLSSLVFLMAAPVVIAILLLAPSMAELRSNYRGRYACEVIPNLETDRRMEVGSATESIARGLYYLRLDVPANEFYNPGAEGPTDTKLDFIYGNTGQMPEFSEEAAPSWGSRSENIHFLLATNGNTTPWFKYKQPGWDGPYMKKELGADPWGYAYIASVNGFEDGPKPNNYVWLLSAGPNHIVETPADSPTLVGDDLGANLNQMPHIYSSWTCGPKGCGPTKRR
ncbi:MAG: hypothetical protein JW941_03515 [Candidatus Coatesbacteria bacterium]|nr:hypothetical protein [Candidatus Coatesbacteria bacterium]